MGGNARIGSYEDAREAVRSVRSSVRAFAHSEHMTRSGAGETHRNLNIKGKVRECLDTPAMPRVTPIVFAMDGTRSRGDDARVVYEQLMPFLGALHLSGAVTDPQLLFALFGDVNSDRAPIQIGQFESDERMDKDLERLWLEGGGGGTGEESSELVAYYLAHRTKIDAYDKRGEKGFCFFTSDEAPYPKVSRAHLATYLGVDVQKDIETAKVFADLQKKFRTFLIYPGKKLEDRKADIDAEIRQRLLKAGGRFENCSIRASLIWNTYDDLDLHVVTPNGEHIYFSNKVASCGGNLDVDQNGGGPITREPVENIRWVKGTARPGKYTVFVRNFAHHERAIKDIPFKVELEIDGKVESFRGVAKAGRVGPSSDQNAFEFDYNPDVTVSMEGHEAYTDEAILGKWRTCIPDGNIIRLKDAKYTTEAAIGVMMLQRGKKLAQVVAGMRERAIADDGIDIVKAALKGFAAQGVFDDVGDSAFA